MKRDNIFLIKNSHWYFKHKLEAIIGRRIIQKQESTELFVVIFWS